MAKVTAKIKAHGLHEGEQVTIEVIEISGDNYDEEDYDWWEDDEHQIILLKNGVEDEETRFLFDGYTHIRYAEGAKCPSCYNPPFNSAAAYWLALKKYFDSPPEATAEGEVIPVEYSEEERRRIRF